MFLYIFCRVVFWFVKGPPGQEANTVWGGREVEEFEGPLAYTTGSQVREYQDVYNVLWQFSQAPRSS